MSLNIVVDWDSFCCEICEVFMLEKSEKLGGIGKKLFKLINVKLVKGNIIEGIV